MKRIKRLKRKSVVSKSAEKLDVGARGRGIARGNALGKGSWRNKSRVDVGASPGLLLVGATGFEPVTSAV